MAINYTEYTRQEDYVDAVVELISRIEGHDVAVTDHQDNEATIGYGYTFGRSNNVALWTDAGITLTPAQLLVLQRIDNASTKEEKNRIAFSEFTRTITTDEARALLRQTYPKYEGPANDLSMPLSPERVAFVSVTYNRGAGRVRSTMADFYQAIRDGDRAEAWFQLRYNALGNQNPLFVNGIAKRRYLESQVFGLYDDPDNVDAQEAASVFKMLQRHRKEIYDHEARFGQKFDGSNGTRNMIAEGNNDANYQLVLDHFELDRIDTMRQSLDHGKPALLEDLRTRYQNIPGIDTRLADNNVISTNIYYNPSKLTDSDRSYILDARDYETGSYESTGANDVMIGLDQTDFMYGGKGDDTLIGEAGDDVLTGGKGDDLLIGGDGDDTYHYKSGDGNDQIIDTGENTIIIEEANGNTRTITNVYKTGAEIWTTPDGKVEITHHSPYQIVLEDGSTIQLGENFHDGDFGIHLLDVPNAPKPNIVGDLTPHDFDPITDGIQIKTDEWGNIITDSGNPSPNRNDMLYDTTGNDRIEGKGGDDYINAKRGGDDWLLGKIIRRVA